MVVIKGIQILRPDARSLHMKAPLRSPEMPRPTATDFLPVIRWRLIGMSIPHFFIDRPRFAVVISIVIVLLGVIAFPNLPVAQFPEVAPPTVVVRASYPGATPDVVAETVAAPLEQEINGVERMLYMSSKCTNDGQMNLDVTFELGTNLDTAQVLVQNRVAIAGPRLPEEVPAHRRDRQRRAPRTFCLSFRCFSQRSLRSALH
jgi:multidrug efflux pump subunit AcrB